ncbi:hypothetical protein QQP08_022290 [Theobroma cacao]|nr:hypothetical protein QQP08_022290 [Theobroma cacao]
MATKLHKQEDVLIVQHGISRERMSGSFITLSPFSKITVLRLRFAEFWDEKYANTCDRRILSLIY